MMGSTEKLSYGRICRSGKCTVCNMAAKEGETFTPKQKRCQEFWMFYYNKTLFFSLDCKNYQIFQATLIVEPSCLSSKTSLFLTLTHTSRALLSPTFSDQFKTFIFILDIFSRCWCWLPSRKAPPTFPRLHASRISSCILMTFLSF